MCLHLLHHVHWNISIISSLYINTYNIIVFFSRVLNSEWPPLSHWIGTAVATQVFVQLRREGLPHRRCQGPMGREGRWCCQGWIQLGRTWRHHTQSHVHRRWPQRFQRGRTQVWHSPSPDPRCSRTSLPPRLPSLRPIYTRELTKHIKPSLPYVLYY